MPISKIKNGIGILFGSAGLTAVLIYMIGEILESGSITALIQKSLYEEPLHHNIFLLFGAIPASMAVGYFYQKLKNLQLNLERTIEERTERLRESEEKLRESEERLRDLYESIPDSLAVYVGKVGQLIDYNKAFKKAYGYTDEELKDKTFLDFVHPDDHAMLIEEYRKEHPEEELPFRCEIKGINKKGETIPIEISVGTYKKKGRVIGIEVMHRDITERKKIEAEVAYERDLLHALMDNIPDVIYFKDVASRFTRTNRAHALRLKIKDPEETIGKTEFDYYAEEFAREAYADEQRIFKTGKPLVKKIEKVKWRDGKSRWVSTTKVPIIDKNGRITGLVGISRDITERKEMERKLQEYAEHLEDMVEKRTKELRESQERLIKSERLAAIGQLATAVGHDLRSPLSAIKNACYYLKMKMGASRDEKVKKMFGIMDGEINYANNIVKDLMDFSRVKKPDLKKVDIISSIQEAITQLKFPENVKLTTKFSEVPAIEADPDQLRRIFQNIALNGAQAMPDGGELTVSTRKNGDFVEAAFTDTGVGIPEENMEKLFTPLFTTKSQGVGLGLAICKNLVEAHNGRIELKSKVGEGTTFTVKLPINQNKEGEKQT